MREVGRVREGLQMRRRDFIRAGTLTGLVASAGAIGGAGNPLAAIVGGPGRRADNGRVRLSSNENPLGISPAAKDALVEAIVLSNRYPADQHRALVAKLAAAHEVAENQVVLGTGSAEVLQMAVQAYAAPRAKLVMAEPNEAVTGGVHPALVYLCNPNNPTATITSSAAIDAWIADAPEHVFFLSDEAYIEYVEDERMWSSLPWIGKKRNVLVVRTFSKIYGLAGLRIGYGIAHPDTAARLSDFASRNNINQLAIAAAGASFRDQVLMEKSRAANRESREMVEATLDDLGLDRMPTQANFLMHRINGDLATYRGRMAEAGFLVGRDFPPMLDWNRLSFGLPEDMGRFCDTLREFRGKGWI